MGFEIVLYDSAIRIGCYKQGWVDADDGGALGDGRA